MANINLASKTAEKTEIKIPFARQVIKKFTTEGGFHFKQVEVAYETFGKLNTAKDNAVLVFHAFTGSSHVTRNNLDMEPEGWWEGLVGPSKTIDTNKYFVICSNVLGGCYGTTGPSSTNPETGRPYAMDFPVITIRDMVRLQKRLLDSMGIVSLYAVIGGSMGGMMAMEWAVTYPETVQKSIVLAAPLWQSPMQIAYNLISLQAIYNDPDWAGGNYFGKHKPHRGLALARMMGVLTYKSEALFRERFDINLQKSGGAYSLYDRYDVENYLMYQGEKFVRRFDANSYIYLSKAMNLHNVAFPYKSVDEALSRIKCKMLLVGIDNDLLYPASQVKTSAALLSQAGVDVTYKEMTSVQGHDGFLTEYAQLSSIIGSFL